jgi:hypothetical protein
MPSLPQQYTAGTSLIMRQFLILPVISNPSYITGQFQVLYKVLKISNEQ